jgi:hypothetical protein
MVFGLRCMMALSMVFGGHCMVALSLLFGLRCMVALSALSLVIFLFLLTPVRGGGHFLWFFLCRSPKKEPKKAARAWTVSGRDLARSSTWHAPQCRRLITNGVGASFTAPSHGLLFWRGIIHPSRHCVLNEGSSSFPRGRQTRSAILARERDGDPPRGTNPVMACTLRRSAKHKDGTKRKGTTSMDPARTQLRKRQHHR